MPQSLAPSGEPSRRSGLRILAWIAGTVVFLVVAVMVAAALLVNSSVVSSVVHERVLPQISQRIGREVTTGDVKIHILPSPSVEIAEVTVPGDTPDRPLLFTRRAVGRLDLWDLLKSFGKEISLSSLDLREAEVNLVRHPDGTWSYQPILDHLAATKSQAESQGPGRNVLISRASIIDGVVRIVDQSAPGGAATGEIRHLDVDARHIAFGEPLSVELKAALQRESRNLEANFTVDPLPKDLASLGPGQWPVIKGQFDINAAPLGQLRNLLPAGLSEVVTGGLLHSHGEIATEEGRYVARGDGRASDLQLRGQPAEGSFLFVASVDPANKKDLRLEANSIQVRGPGVDLGGNVALQGTQEFQFNLAGPLLDLDTLLAALPQQEPTGAHGPLIPLAAQEKIRSMEGVGTLAVEKVTRGRLTANDVKARATVSKGVLRLDEARAGFYGGTVDAAGSSVDLTQPVPKWNLDGNMEAVQLARAMTEITGKDPLTGLMNGRIALVGSGVDWSHLAQALTGSGTLRIANSALTTSNLEGKLVGALGQGMAAIGMGPKAPTNMAGGTPLGDLQARFVVKNGWLALQQPVEANAPFGRLKLGGRIGLDKRLDLSGTATLSPEWLAQLTGQKFLGQAGVPIPIQITGTLDDPKVEGIPTESVAMALLPVGKVEKKVAREAEKQKNQALKAAQQKAREILKGF